MSLSLVNFCGLLMFEYVYQAAVESLIRKERLDLKLSDHEIPSRMCT